MRIVTQEEYKEISPIFKENMIKLAKHENKNSYYGQVAINSCYTRKINEYSKLFQLFTPSFLTIIEKDYSNALTENPECFGTYNAKDVIHALYIQAQKKKFSGGEKQYIEYLTNECFCLLLCKKGNEFIDDVLRIDLFRKLDPSKDFTNYYDFTGGIFHSLKHFSIGGQCASIYPNQNVLLYDVEQLIWPIAKAFFEGNIREGKYTNTYETEVFYLNKMMTNWQF